MHAFGPQLLPRTQRMAIAHEIAERVKERFGLEVFAIGLYGSLARQEDGPYSEATASTKPVRITDALTWLAARS